MTNRAQRCAAQILRGREYSIPVNVYSIAEAHNIIVRPETLEEAVSGLLVIQDDHAVIAVNERHHPNRQRFTIAHEIGHFLLHRDSATVFIDASPLFFRDERSAKGTDVEEIEANTFAAELLMPEPVLRELVNDQAVDPFDERALQRLAAEFGVSTLALTIRLTRLNLIAA
jgi:Zn-dependent peptidase ImmA (M78 family)